MEKITDRSNMVKIFRFLFVCAVLLAIAGCGFVGITLWYFGRDLPDYQQLAHYQPPIMTRVQAGDGRLLAEYATERRIFVPIQAIPKPVINAFLSAEDKNFYNHHGVDPVSILRAAITDVSRFRANRRPVGASTITQQVAKNMLLSNEVSVERKIKEILLATRIEAALPKERKPKLSPPSFAIGRRRKRSEPPISPRRSGATCWPAMAKKFCTGLGCRCAPASMSDCRRLRIKRCAPG